MRAVVPALPPHPAPSPTKGEGKTKEWRILTTPSMSGQANMDFDRQTLARAQENLDASAVLRFFRFHQPTVSFGRLQKREDIQSLIPPDWPAVQRPTGGGIVFHSDDLCLSLCWRQGIAPLPLRIQDQYAWIHRVIQKVITPFQEVTMASGRDGKSRPSSFPVRQCFQEPAMFDLLSDHRKIVGGALCRQKNVFLYQGSIQGIFHLDLEPLLLRTFQEQLTPIPQ